MSTDKITYAALKGAVTAAALSLTAAGWLGWSLGPEALVGHAYWNLSRAAGLVGYTLLWLSVVAGLLLSGRMARQNLSPKTVMALHQTLSGSALAFAFFHALVLTGDRYLNLSLAQILVPLASPYQRLWVGAGQLALVLLSAIAVSSHWRRRFGNKVWRLLHKSAFATYWLVLAHAIVVGSESTVPLVTLYYAFTATTVMWLTTSRILIREGS